MTPKSPLAHMVCWRCLIVARSSAWGMIVIGGSSGGREGRDRGGVRSVPGRGFSAVTMARWRAETGSCTVGALDALDGIEFRILGPLEVHGRDGVVTVGGARQRALLAVLLLHANETLSADRLIDELW